MLVSWCAYTGIQSYNEHVKEIKEHRNKAEIDAQYDRLVGQIRSLDDPDASNYQDVANKLLKIHWKDIDDSDYNKSVREDYFREKKSVAQKIHEIWMSEMEKTPDDSSIPISDEIQWISIYLQY